MKFTESELPQSADACTGRALKKGELILDDDGIFWFVGDVEKYRKHDPQTDVWYVPIHQAVYRNGRAKSRLVADKAGYVRECQSNEMVPVYDPADVIRVIEADMDKYIPSTR